MKEIELYVFSEARALKLSAQRRNERNDKKTEKRCVARLGRDVEKGEAGRRETERGEQEKKHGVRFTITVFSRSHSISKQSLAKQNNRGLAGDSRGRRDNAEHHHNKLSTEQRARTRGAETQKKKKDRQETRSKNFVPRGRTRSG